VFNPIAARRQSRPTKWQIASLHQCVIAGFFAWNRESALTFAALDEKFFARSRIKNRLL
jgi:hypothetical protein